MFDMHGMCVHAGPATLVNCVIFTTWKTMHSPALAGSEQMQNRCWLRSPQSTKTCNSFALPTRCMAPHSRARSVLAYSMQILGHGTTGGIMIAAITDQQVEKYRYASTHAVPNEQHVCSSSMQCTCTPPIAGLLWRLCHHDLGSAASKNRKYVGMRCNGPCCQSN